MMDPHECGSPCSPEAGVTGLSQTVFGTHNFSSLILRKSSDRLANGQGQRWPPGGEAGASGKPLLLYARDGGFAAFWGSQDPLHSSSMLSPQPHGGYTALNYSELKSILRLVWPEGPWNVLLSVISFAEGQPGTAGLALPMAGVRGRRVWRSVSKTSDDLPPRARWALSRHGCHEAKCYDARGVFSLRTEAAVWGTVCQTRGKANANRATAAFARWPAFIRGSLL